MSLLSSALRCASVLGLALAMGCERDPGRADVPPPFDASWDRVDASAEDTATDLVDASSAELPSVDLGRTLPDGALVDVRLGEFPSFVADCSVPLGDPRRETQETRCDGVDNDCDGQVDLLLPSGSNACSVEARGVCAAGWAGCAEGARRCFAPGPSPEVSDGLDNDCDGVVDNARAASLRPRVLVLAPRYLWTKGGDEIRALASILDQWGIPYDLPTADTEFSAALRGLLGRYSLAIVPGYLEGEAVDTIARLYLEEFATAGGVVLLHKPLTTPSSADLLRLAGLRRTTRRTDVTSLRVGGVAVPAVRSLDTAEERDLLVTDDPSARPVETFVLEPDPEATTVVAARAFAGATEVGAVLTRRAVGLGAVYTLGHDLHSWSHYRCYVNCFEPAGDVLGLLIRDALREGASGHLVVKHTVPGLEDAILFSTHDIDATESARSGPWGAAGATQMGSVLYGRGAIGSFFFTTDYVSGWWDPATVRSVCALGMCPVGGHSVRHFASPPSQPVGDCSERFPGYVPTTLAESTLCGEARVSLMLAGEAAGSAAVAWRSPFLDVHPRLFDVLSEQGVRVDSSFAVGDFKTNLPLDLAATFHRQDLFHHRGLTELPVTLDDGFGARDEHGTLRTELQASNASSFLSAWSSVMLRNAANNAHTTLLLHPSFGVGQGPENLQVKLAVIDRLLQLAAAAGLRTDVSVTALDAFWRARRGALVDATYDSTRGYQGTITAGPSSVPGLTLEFGDALRRFDCPDCGPTLVGGRRVVLLGALPPGRRVEFTALPR
ncbi:MAG: hypothetical protein EPO40_01525 [Myxococcaceae bacterium]|nr:MAG: hypothetical protein EPO40_01525 [Myxococcaceae bacterium]